MLCCLVGLSVVYFFFYGFGNTSIDQYFSLTNAILANFYKKKKICYILFETMHSLEEKRKVNCRFLLNNKFSVILIIPLILICMFICIFIVI